MTSILIVSHDMVGSRMAGPGIRYWEISRTLAAGHQVLLACPNQPDIRGQGFELTGYNRQDAHSLDKHAGQSEVIMLCGDTLELFPGLKETGKPLVVDLYDPFILENLQMGRDLPAPEQQARLESGLHVLRGLLEAGDFFLCANQRQRDFWLGMLTAWGRLGPEDYQLDPSLEKLIAIVSFGVPSEPPRRVTPVLKGAWPGIAPQDKVILWGGGIWDWLDPLTAIRAMGWLRYRRDDVRLFFLGARHPNHAAVPEMKAAMEARRLSEEMGLLDSHVFFNEWTPYLDRADYLLEADLGISLHLDLVETRFASRTRLLDYFWAGLPMVVTGGDPLAEQVAASGLGRVVGFQDVEGVGRALLEMLERPQLKDTLAARFLEVASSLRWETACAPLLNFCDQPWLSARHAPAVVPGPKPGGAGALSRAVSRLRGTR